MIVTCERCATQFQLDDSRIPAEGVRVRCSRCKHAFEVHLPRAAGAPPPAEEEESDWQFNRDPPAGSPDSTFDGLGPRGGAGAGGSAETPADLADPGEGASGLDLAGGPLGGDPGWDAPSPSLDEAEPDSLFERPAPPPLDSAPAAAAPTSPAPPGPPPRSLFEAPPEQPIEMPEEPSSELDALVRESRERGSGLDLAAPADDELASPSDWDGQGGGPDDGDLGAPTPSRRFDVDPDELVDDRPRWQGWITNAGGAVGWTAVLALFALGLQGGLRPPASPEPAPIPVADGVQVSGLSGRWIEHVEMGPIYVVQGRLINQRGSLVPAPRLAVELVDAAGTPVAGPAALTLPSRPEDLREAPLAVLADSGSRGLPLGLRPGEQRDVQAVIGPLPAGARQLRVVPADPARATARAAAPPPQPPATGPAPEIPADEPASAAPGAPPAAPAP